MDDDDDGDDDDQQTTHPHTTHMGLVGPCSNDGRKKGAIEEWMMMRMRMMMINKQHIRTPHTWG